MNLPIDTPTLILLIYLVVLNVIGFSLMDHDKTSAKQGRRRTSERTLFLVAILGGSLGILRGMYTYRHKTRHMSFVIGIPLIIIAQIVAAVFIMVKI